eukprot:CAMPEP_0197298850 /NCGR_PEP_ID=MMETSP0890-20130614/44605_1 /TAXON_ID=44058 ORGANISM="Aureoumbra lagunensis, Strain CCMP1510" /NCGR_SAMPLE_ID=MMETSP0890 /ASSEMBLY_ACC=CAM_ASM_000533 /LENGTH=131 /DNA_ID=CAMNT_0042776847 /DNA_START=177 /DNA_END=572 /DNA_ORIENTATION=-
MMEIDEEKKTKMTGGERHRQKVALRRAKRLQKVALRAMRLRLPKSSKEQRSARKALTNELKELKCTTEDDMIQNINTGQEDSATAAAIIEENDVQMASEEEVDTFFRYKVNPKAARRAERRRRNSMLKELR